MKNHSCTMPRVLTYSLHTMQSQCVKNPSLMDYFQLLFSKQKSFVYKPKLVGCYTPNDISYTKLMCLFVNSGFLESHRRLRTSSTLFGLSPSKCSKTSPGHSPEGESSPSCYYPTQVSFSFFMQACYSIRLHPTVLRPPIKHQVRCLIGTIHSHP